MKVISFDLGTRHLAYCIVEKLQYENGQLFRFNILRWELIDLLANGAKNPAQIIDELVFQLSKREWLLPWTPVIIEKQPDGRGTTSAIASTVKAVGHAIQVYFRVSDPDRPVLFQSAKGKLRWWDDVDTDCSRSSRYARNKHASISLTRRMLSQQNQSEWLYFFRTYTKQDDLADSYMQAVTYLAGIEVKSYPRLLEDADDQLTLRDTYCSFDDLLYADLHLKQDA